MTTFTWPSTLRPMSMPLRFIGRNKRFDSPMNGFTQIASRPGSKLGFDLVFTFLTEAQRDELVGFIAKMNGQENNFTIPYYGHVNRGLGGGTPVISGAGQTGASIATSGWPNSTAILKRGDTVGIGTQLVIVTDDTSSNGSGLATLPVRPGIRTAPSNGSSVVFTDATGVFMLENPTNAIESVTSPLIRSGRAQFGIIEVY